MTDRYSTLRLGLVGAWCPSLGATGYTLLDRSGRSQHGTLTNMGGQVNWPAIGSGTAIAFDGSNDFVSLPASAATGSAVWLSLWFRLTGTLTTANRYTFVLPSLEGVSPFRQNLCFGVRLMGFGSSESTTSLNVLTYDGNVSQGFGLSGAYTATQYGTNTSWNHVSAGWDQRSSAWRIFVNGVEDTVAEQVQRAPSAQPLASGFIGGSSGRYTPVQMDDIRLYNRALTLSETRLLASQRGIGLVPTRHRRARLAASAATTMWLKVGGVWKTTTPHINVGGTWKAATPKINVGGTWKG